jgi:hypothetical protein
MPNSALQNRVVKTLSAAQILSGVGVAGTVAAGSLLVSSITDSETLAGTCPNKCGIRRCSISTAFSSIKPQKVDAD